MTINDPRHLAFKFPPSFVGFDDIFDEVKNLASGAKSYPPHNLIEIDKTSYMLEIAVAGYSSDDIEIVVEDGVLTVRTKDSYENSDESRYGEESVVMHKEISSKRFEKSFKLYDGIEVLGASHKDGILKIGLEKVIPEEKKPRLIDIQ